MSLMSHVVVRLPSNGQLFEYLETRRHHEICNILGSRERKLAARYNGSAIGALICAPCIELSWAGRRDFASRLDKGLPAT
jgi:hypothetical protein